MRFPELEMERLYILPPKNLSAPASACSKTTLNKGGEGGAGVDPQTRKIGTQNLIRHELRMSQTKISTFYCSKKWKFLFETFLARA